MKRCPQCDFIYENDQNFCDIDGNELVFEPSIYEPSPLPVAEKAEAQSAAPSAKSRWRGFAVLPIAGVICGAVPFLVYYAIMPRTAPPATDHSAVKVTSESQPEPSPAPASPAASPTPAVTSPVRSPGTNVTAAMVASPAVEATPSPALAPTPTPSPPPRPEEKRARTESANRKKESKLGSVLKKAGRILKKPF